jgi:hypothetical protein
MISQLKLNRPEDTSESEDQDSMSFPNSITKSQSRENEDISKMFRMTVTETVMPGHDHHFSLKKTSWMADRFSEPYRLDDQ